GPGHAGPRHPYPGRELRRHSCAHATCRAASRFRSPCAGQRHLGMWLDRRRASRTVRTVTSALTTYLQRQVAALSSAPSEGDIQPMARLSGAEVDHVGVALCSVDGEITAVGTD